MKKSNVYLIGMILLFLFIILYGILGTIDHERIHQAIYKHYGIETEVKYHFLSLDGVSGTTRAIGDVSNCKEACKTSNELNEIVSYNLNLAMAFFSLMFFIYLLIEGMKATIDETERFK